MVYIWVILKPTSRHCLTTEWRITIEKYGRSCEMGATSNDGPVTFQDLWLHWQPPCSSPPSTQLPDGWMKEIPAWWQSLSCKWLLHTSATERAWPWVTAALLMVSCWTGDTTVTSRAADCPLFQQGRKISAGRLLEPGIYKGRGLLLRG